MGVTDGTITNTKYAEVVSTEQGTAGPANAGWYMRVSDGSGDLAAVSGLNQLLVTTGLESAITTFSGASALSNGTTAAMGSAKSNISMVITAGAGVSAGVVALEVSQDNTNWYRHTTTVTLTAPGVTQITMSGFAFRFARGVITTAITGGTVGATIMAT